MNAKARRKEKARNPAGKVTRQEVSQAFQLASQDVHSLRVALAWLSDFFIEKNLYTVEELNAFFEKKRAEIQPPPPEAPSAQ